MGRSVGRKVGLYGGLLYGYLRGHVDQESSVERPCQDLDSKVPKALGSGKHICRGWTQPYQSIGYTQKRNVRVYCHHSRKYRVILVWKTSVGTRVWEETVWLQGGEKDFPKETHSLIWKLIVWFGRSILVYKVDRSRAGADIRAGVML